MKSRFPTALIFCGVLCIAPSLFFAQSARKVWADVEGPKIVGAVLKEGASGIIQVSFILEIGGEGADRAVVEITQPSGALVGSKAVGRSSREIKTAEFMPEKSGQYIITVKAYRNGETIVKESSPVIFDFEYPLAAPSVDARNLGNGTMLLSWKEVREAESYTVAWRNRITGVSGERQSVTGTTAEITGLTIGQAYDFIVASVRKEKKSSAAPLAKTVRAESDRVWTFTRFGQSSNADINTFEILNADTLSFRLNSCTFAPNGDTLLKGGKFTAFHDGISFYYTVIDAKRENFELTATFTVDYINPVPDGQEGFGLLVMDSLGRHGISMENHYTNSAGIIATKFEETIMGVKKTSKDTVGARFVSNITDTVLALGNEGIAEHGESVSHAFSYDQSNLVKKGDIYTFTLKKTNTGYHAIYAKKFATDETITEYVMYGPDKLLQLDKDHVYAGFAAARGCNVTVTDVRMIITDPAKDPPAREEPPILVPLEARVDSPPAWTNGSYPFVFISNADGKVNVKDTNGKELIRFSPVKAGVDFTATLNLNPGLNDFRITFVPDPTFRPGPKSILAVPDRETGTYVPITSPVTISLSVARNSYAGPELQVSPDGNFMGKGTRESPLDLATALAYVSPGQTIVLADGVYRSSRGIIIRRGNSGTVSARKTLRSGDGEHAIIDFTSSGGGFVLSGDYWTVKNIEIRNTDGNVKGFQIAGNHNIAESIVTHDCGDTGLQISGSSAEPFEKWPQHNLVLNCTSYNNCDPAENNADGFAAKLTCGNGNVFRGCIAYSNIDDGWDLFSKIETGPIGAVLIEDCVAYKNGSRLDGTGNGDGNGFKLGGDGIAVPHITRNCISFRNGTSGITSNSNPAIIVENCTAYANGGANVNLYGKGTGERQFKVRVIISMKGGLGDTIKELSVPIDPSNYFWNGASCVNSSGQTLNTDIFVSVNPDTIPGRKPNGTIDMKEFLELKPNAQLGAGASFK